MSRAARADRARAATATRSPDRRCRRRRPCPASRSSRESPSRTSIELRFNSSSAPIAAARASLSSLDDTTHTRAPMFLQICSAANATPPPMPQMRTSSPALTRARLTIIRHAVSVASGKAAACSGDTVRGIVCAFFPGTTTYSRHRTRHVLAEDPVARTERLFAVETVLARAVAHPRIENDIVADGHVLHVVADGVDHPACIGAEDEGRRQLHARQAADDEQVEMIEGGRAARGRARRSAPAARAWAGRRGPRSARFRRFSRWSVRARLSLGRLILANRQNTLSSHPAVTLSHRHSITSSYGRNQSSPAR